jgi:oligopeptide/dipeptide ABC transporter ATP-binding protein
MYAGATIEQQASPALARAPFHPYSAGLLRSRQRLPGSARLGVIPGSPVAAYDAPTGCAFHPRCRFAVERCGIDTPERRSLGEGEVACHRSEDIGPELVIDQGAVPRA